MDRNNLPNSFFHTVEWKKMKICATFGNIFEELSPSSTKWTLQVRVEVSKEASLAERIKLWAIIEALDKLGKIKNGLCKYMKAFKKFAEAEL